MTRYNRDGGPVDVTHEKIAKVEATFLGRESHGVITANLIVSYGGTGQGVGGYVLDTPIKDENDQFVCRQGTAYGMEWIIRCLDACGVDNWEKVKGRTIFVYFDSDNCNAKPIGIGPLPTEPGKRFMFDELRADMGGEA